MATEKYEPISCVFYDLIEHYATLKKEVTIIYLKAHEDPEPIIIQAKILDTKAKDKVEYLLIEGMTDPLRMDLLISIEGEILENYNNC